MSVIHFLNVLEGDCNIIQHDTGRVSVIDVSNAYNQIDTEAEKAKKASLARIAMHKMEVPQGKINFNQKSYPDNPIDYLKKLGSPSLFRFIITHPDMDHLDGIKDLFDSFEILNIWDTDNNKEILNFNGGGYNKDDWQFYKRIREAKVDNRKVFLAGNSVQFFNEDYIHILAPTKQLCDEANECQDYNDSSYVLLYTPPKNGGQWKILFAGDSHDKTWEYILKNHNNQVKDVDILFAPHHGRDSQRNYDFLDILNPKVTLFGNANSQHLAYDKYPEIRITNNQAGYVILDISLSDLKIYVKNKAFANHFRNNPKRKWGDAPYSTKHDAYFLFRYQAG
jgi:competence protein ComEC